MKQRDVYLYDDEPSLQYTIRVVRRELRRQSRCPDISIANKNWDWRVLRTCFSRKNAGGFHLLFSDG